MLNLLKVLVSSLQHSQDEQVQMVTRYKSFLLESKDSSIQIYDVLYKIVDQNEHLDLAG